MTATDRTPRTADPALDLKRRAAHLVVLWAFAVVQPTVGVLKQGPDLFVERKVDGFTFLAVVIAYALVPPLLLAGLERLAGLVSPRLERVLHAVFVAGLVGVFALYLLRQAFPTAGLTLLAAAAVAGIVIAAVYARAEPVRFFVLLLLPAPVVFIVLFLLSPSRGLIFPDEAGAAVKSRPIPVVLMVFDELPVSSLMDRGQRVNAARFPNFARFAAGSTWYRNVASVADQTEEAVPALLDGQRPRRGRIPTFTDHPDTLLRLLSSTHAVTAEEHITWLCPPSICRQQEPVARRALDLASAISLVSLAAITPGPYQDRLPAIGRTWGEALADEGPTAQVDPRSASTAELARRGLAQFERFLDDLGQWKAGRRPPFYFFHSALPHIPWTYSPAGKAYAGIRDVPAGLSPALTHWAPNAAATDLGYQRHLLQVGLADRLLGRLVARLRGLDLYDRALVVVVADHGVSFHPDGDRRRVSAPNIGDVSLVPLFVKGPGQTRGRTDETWMQSDALVPLVARALELPIDQRIPSANEEARVFRHRDQQTVTAPAEALLAQRRQTLEHEVATFGNRGFDDEFYGLGPFGDLVGRPLAELEVAPGRARAVVAAERDFRHVDLRSPYLPLLVRGTVAGAAPRELAVAVNGRVAATAPSLPGVNGGSRFAIMIPDGVLRAGANRVQVLAVDRGADGPKLSLLTPP